MKTRLMTLLGLIVVASMVLAACGSPATAEPTKAPAATEAPSATPEPTKSVRKGGWLDEIVFSVVAGDSAITQLQAGAIDIYANSLASADLPAIKEAGLKYSNQNGLYYDLMFNPAAFTDETKLNPYSNRKIREAMNWLVDRNKINQDVYAGGGLAKFFPIQTNGPDYADLADVARGLESKYAYNLDKAKEVVTAEMEGMGATLVDGKWSYKGQPVTLIFLIRPDSDGTRKLIGDYFASQLESIGFTVDRQYKKSSEAAPIWLGSDPKEGQWHLYTAAWSSNQIDRDEKHMFQQMYLNTSTQGSQPFLSNVSDEEFQKLADDLANSNFPDLATRREMMVKAMSLALEDSLQVWLIDGKNYAPFVQGVDVTYDLAAGVEGAQIWPYTLRFSGKEGGQLKWATQGMFGDPWNPVAGSNWAYDQGAIRGTRSGAVMFDPHTGLIHPLRMEKAEVIAEKGLPIGKTMDWVDLKFEDKVMIPDDAMVDWDAEKQVFITAKEIAPMIAEAKAAKEAYDKLSGEVDPKQKEKVTELVGKLTLTGITADAIKAVVADAAASLKELGGGDAPEVDSAALDELVLALNAEATAEQPAMTDEEKVAAIEEFVSGYAMVPALDADTVSLAGRDYTTAKVKTLVYYPANLFEIVKWHDGSNLSVADFMMGMIMNFDRAKAKSAIYDPDQAVPGFESFLSSFKGFKIASTQPLVVEVYSNVYAQDAELNITTLWPGPTIYQYGEAGWHQIAISNLAEENNELAYSREKADIKKVESTNYIGGPSLEILAKYLDKAETEGYVPYAATLGQYITADEAKARYANLKKFYTDHGHFWLGTGPYFLDKVFLTEQSVVLKNNPDFPDAADRWAIFGEPKIASVLLDGAGQVKIGAEATFDVSVTFKDQPYPSAEIKGVKYLVYNAKNEVVSVGEATLVSDGQYKIVIPADVTSKLEAGANRIEVAVVPLPVNIPTFVSFDFVTAE